LAYGLTSADATADSDGDGLTNLQEYQAGTNPRDPNSALRVTSATAIGNKFAVTFPSVAGKVYAVEYANLLPSSTWQILATNIAGTGSAISITDTIPAGVGQRFYRVKLLP
jgi:Bacterial TSP3 repeat